MNFKEYLEIVLDNKIVTTQEEFNIVSQTNKEIFKLIQSYIEKHGDVAITCGSEWMYQDDNGQTDALKLVGNILDTLNIFDTNI